MKMIAGADLCFGVVQLPEAGVIQAPIALKDLPLLARNWSGGDGGQFVLSICFVKSSMRHIQAAKPIKALEKPTFIGNANDDKVRMWRIGKKKRFSDFKNGVAGLDDLLRKRQVSPDKYVNVLSGRALGEFHGRLR
jgi:hypothetical protein